MFILLFCGSALSAHAQGQLVFNNRITNVLMAPIFGAEQDDSTIRKHGNTVSGIPSGSQQYTGILLSGAAYTAQLFGGPTSAPVADLAALSPATTFRTGPEAGFVVAPPFAVRVPGVPEGEPAQVILRVWQSNSGATNWSQVLADTNLLRGESLPFVTPPLGGIYVPPPNLLGLRSFNLALPPRPIPIMITSGSHSAAGDFIINFTAPTNRSYTIEVSSDLNAWSVISSNMFVPTSPWYFEDTAAAAFSRRFYRLR